MYNTFHDFEGVFYRIEGKCFFVFKKGNRGSHLAIKRKGVSLAEEISEFTPAKTRRVQEDVSKNIFQRTSEEQVSHGKNLRSSTLTTKTRRT